MPRSNDRIRVDAAGRVEIVDPCLEDLPLLHSINPQFRVAAEPLPGFVAPRLHDARTTSTTISRRDLAGMSVADLWAEHDRILAGVRRGRHLERGLTLLEFKAAIASRLLKQCVLCARRCEVDRTAGSVGSCGLGTKAFVAEHFTHVAEEAPINPSLLLQLRGCAARCRGCQQHALLDPRGHPSEEMGADLWSRLDFHGARSLSFCGGNPDESLVSILTFLAAAPASLAVPVVWNNNAFMSDEAIKLLNGVVDAYVPDLKFDRESCARSYMKIEGYPATARAAVTSLLAQSVPVIVRILVLPGHVECCHVPSLVWLASLGSPNVLVSVRDQFVPDWRISAGDGLGRRPSTPEVNEVRQSAARLGLRQVGG